MAAFPATALFAIGGMGLPIVGILSYAGLRVGSEGGPYVAFLGILFWSVPGFFGAAAYQLFLARRCRRRDAAPRSWIAFLLGLAFSPLPLVLLPIAYSTQGRIDPEEGLWFLPVAGAALGLAFAAMTPLQGKQGGLEIPASRF